MSEPNIKDRLQNYIYLRMERDNRRERITRMKAEEQLPAMREPDGSQHTGGSGDRMAGAIIRRMEYEEKARPIIEANEREMAAIEEAINRIPNPMEREVLRLRYIDGEYCRHLTWDEIAMRIYGNDDESANKAAKRLHGGALNSLRKLFQ